MKSAAQYQTAISAATTMETGRTLFIGARSASLASREKVAFA
jgi:hypothetical protein